MSRGRVLRHEARLIPHALLRAAHLEARHRAVPRARLNPIELYALDAGAREVRRGPEDVALDVLEERRAGSCPYPDGRDVPDDAERGYAA
jgi:hypothetical protein